MQNMQQIYYSCLELMNAINRFALSTKKVTVFKNSDLSNPTDCIQVYHPGFYEKGGIPGVKIPTCTLTDFLSMWKIFLEGHSKVINITLKDEFMRKKPLGQFGKQESKLVAGISGPIPSSGRQHMHTFRHFEWPSTVALCFRDADKSTTRSYGG